MKWQPECRKTSYWRWWQARLPGHLSGITSPNEHYSTALGFQNVYTITQCYWHCGRENMLNTHSKIIPSSRDCFRKGQEDEKQGSGWGHTYAYVYKVIEEIGLCLIISVIHASGRGERGGARRSTEAETKSVQKELEEQKKIRTRKMKQGKQDNETTSEESQPKTVIRGKKSSNKWETICMGNRGVQEKSVRCFGYFILRQRLHTVWPLRLEATSSPIS